MNNTSKRINPTVKNNMYTIHALEEHMDRDWTELGFGKNGDELSGMCAKLLNISHEEFLSYMKLEKEN